jgi:hypothetical protein
MPRLAINSFLVVSAIALLVGCNGRESVTYWQSERYVLLAVYTKGQMSLSFEIGEGTTMQLVNATVFSIGASDKYIVVQQHPSTDDFGHFNRSVTNYYIVERSESPIFAEREKGVRGPLTQLEFQKLASSLALPAFTITFDDLR